MKNDEKKIEQLLKLKKVGYNKIFGYFIGISKVGLKTIDPTWLP